MAESETDQPVTNPTAAKTAGARNPAAADAGQALPEAENLESQASFAKALEESLAAARAEAAANYDKFMRTAADLENFRRRAVREKDDLRTTATGRVLEDIFPVLDNLALAVTAAKQPGADVKALVGGVELVLGQLKSALASHGLKEINPAGQPFDPHQHEAISHQPSADVKEEHVLTVVRAGYSLNGRLLRPASVIVSSGPAKKSSGEKPVI
ncbi:MAG TPA: nucleotide exchange factor GrpE [Opitutaceae bacterium]|nr:nucleotide exchange factor GrpE [Opitutaceae bacterium]